MIVSCESKSDIKKLQDEIELLRQDSLKFELKKQKEILEINQIEQQIISNELTDTCFGDCENGIGGKMSTNGDYFIGKWKDGFWVSGTYTRKEDNFKFKNLKGFSANGEAHVSHYVNCGCNLYFSTKKSSPNGEKFEGSFECGKRAKGILTYPNGDKFDGNFKNGIRNNGKLEFTYKSMGYTYDGYFDDQGRFSGPMCELIRDDGLKYTGFFSEGSISGFGTLSRGDKIVHEGIWINNHALKRPGLSIF